MDLQRECIVVFFGLMACCGLLDAAGFGRFERMFPSKDDGRTTCEKVAQLREYMESPARHEESKKKSTTAASTSPTTESEPTSHDHTTKPSYVCKRTCQDPTSCDCHERQTCVCPDGFLMNNNRCVSKQDCECYHSEGGFVIPDGDIYVNDDCSERCHCSNNTLSCIHTYACGPDAACKVKDGIRQCYCNDGYLGDGVTCTRLTDCYDAYQAGKRQDGVYAILPRGRTGSPLEVWCDMTTNGGGWTILQRRTNGTLGFNLQWSKFKWGFGSSSGEYWLGNEHMYHLTKQRNYKLRVELLPPNGPALYQECSVFQIANESEYYRLINIGDSNGTAGDGMASLLGRAFSTYHRNNSGCGVNCAAVHGHNGWWYSKKLCDECCDGHNVACFNFRAGGCGRRCTHANLNGFYGELGQHGIFWNDITNIKSTEMKVRPVS